MWEELRVDELEEGDDFSLERASEFVSASEFLFLTFAFRLGNFPNEAYVKKKSSLNIMMWNLLVSMKCLDVLCGGGDDDNREPQQTENRHFAFVHL